MLPVILESGLLVQLPREYECMTAVGQAFRVEVGVDGANLVGTVDISHTHRFVFPITSSSNLFAGYRPKITLPSNYPLDSNAQVSVSAICSGIVHPYYGEDTSF